MSKEYLMDRLRKERSWGVSRDDPDWHNWKGEEEYKAPLFVGQYLETHDPADIVKVNRDNIKHLPTLEEIDSDPSFARTNRAYHMHVSDNLVLAFDIEPRCDPAYLRWFAKQPAHYREYSLHKGIHAFYLLDPDKLSEDTMDMLAERTEYKFKGKSKGLALEYEMMMNKHWITFTRNAFGKMSDLSVPVPDWVYHLLDVATENYLKSKVAETVVDISDSASDLSKWIASSSLFKPAFVKQLKNDYSVADYENDDSKYEWNMAMKISKHLYDEIYGDEGGLSSMASVIFEEKFHYDDLSKVPDSDIVWAISLVLKQVVPPRDKDNTFRHNLPWLVDVSRKVWNFTINPSVYYQKKAEEQAKREQETKIKKDQ